MKKTDAEKVNEYMDKLDYPLKAEVQALREIIQNVDKGITEQIKWNAPTFSYKGYLVTFNLHANEHIRLIFHNGAILHDSSGFLEGEYPDRRIAYFANMDEVNAKKATLENVVKEWIQVMDK